MINGIDYKKFKDEFLETSIGKQILQDFNIVTCTSNNVPSIIELKNKFGTTCRELLGSNDLIVKQPKTTISIVTFYYLEMLKGSEHIYDLGCGWNIWKKYIPNIIGIDSNSPHADVIQSVNDKWIDENYRKFKSVFSINMDIGLKSNSICTFRNLCDQIMNFSSIVKPGGRGYIAMSVLWFYRFTDPEWYIENQCSMYNPQQLANKITDMVSALPLKIISLDCEFDILKNMPTHDGEFRFVFEVPNDVAV